MMTLQDKKENLIQMEWQQFYQVHNEGGRASCQEDPKTFAIMRRSQFTAWPEALVDSYTADLEAAEEVGRNLLTEKYAWMMADTAPEEFAQLRRFLPEPSLLQKEMLDEITQIQIAWMWEYAEKYPRLAAGNRAIRAAEAAPGETSFETYLRGELSIYSAQTLDLYARWTEELEREGVNMSVEVMKETVARYGYKDIQAAEEHEKKKNEVSRKNT